MGNRVAPCSSVLFRCGGPTTRYRRPDRPATDLVKHTSPIPRPPRRQSQAPITGLPRPPSQAGQHEAGSAEGSWLAAHREGPGGQGFVGLRACR